MATPKFMHFIGWSVLCAAVLMACGWAVYQLRLRQIR